MPAPDARTGVSAPARRAWTRAQPRVVPSRARVDPDPAGRLPVPRRRGRVIYVGKAKNLRARLSSYFQDIGNLHPRTATMVTTAASVEWTVVNTEVEALQLEYSWIKEFDPRFNVKYRDDKSYPWLAVTVGEEFPRVMVGRGAKKKGTRYFGPYSHAWAIRETVDLLLRVFPMRSCSNGVFKRSGQIGRPVPARLHRQVLGAVRRQGHRRGAPRDRRRLLRLHGRPDHGRSSGGSSKEMYAASEAQDFEKAARLRDDLGALQQGAREAGGGARRRHRRRRDRARRGPARGRGADLLRPRRPDPRPARLGGRPGRGGRHRRAGRGLPAPALRRRRAGDAIPREILVPALPPDADDVRAAARRPARQQGADPGAAARRQEDAPGDRRQQRRAGAGAAQDQAGQRPDHPQPGAGGDPGRRSSSTRCRCASSATTSPTSRAPRWSRRWWSSRTAWPARASTAAS